MRTLTSAAGRALLSEHFVGVPEWRDLSRVHPPHVRSCCMCVRTCNMHIGEQSKFSHAAMAVVCKVSAFDVVVTDTSAPDSVVGALEAAGVAVRRV